MLFSEDYKSILEPATVANESSTDYMEVAADIVVEGASVLADISSIMNVAEGKAIEAYTEACGNESVIDDETLNKNTVTIRNRDTMEQITLPLDEVVSYIETRLKF